MGTNYYFMIKAKNKEIINKYFDGEYSLVEEPYLGYEIHLNKLSYGWLPLFQRHKAFKTFNELKRFYAENTKYLDIYNEYGEKFSLEEYEDIIYKHSQRKKQPVKWCFGIDPISKIFNEQNPRETIYTDRCSENEAELYMPFRHNEYMKTEKIAREKYNCYPGYNFDVKYFEDPDFEVDWTEGEFS